MGHDARFDGMRDTFPKIAGFWTLQALSVFVLQLPVIWFMGKTSLAATGLTMLQKFALGLWGVGLGIETIADHQKFQFKINPQNKGKFMSQGLFSWVQHPNYLGEIMVWFGHFLFAAPAL